MAARALSTGVRSDEGVSVEQGTARRIGRQGIMRILHETIAKIAFNPRLAILHSALAPRLTWWFVSVNGTTDSRAQS